MPNVFLEQTEISQTAKMNWTCQEVLWISSEPLKMMLPSLNTEKKLTKILLYDYSLRLVSSFYIHVSLCSFYDLKVDVSLTDSNKVTVVNKWQGRRVIYCGLKQTTFLILLECLVYERPRKSGRPSLGRDPRCSELCHRPTHSADIRLAQKQPSSCKVSNYFSQCLFSLF